jgi:tRNA-splicing ligase RtcB
MEGADPSCVSRRAVERGQPQTGTLGAGNHFLEIQKIDTVYDEPSAHCFGLQKGNITIMIHTGSRGLGYQVCDDYLKTIRHASGRYNISPVDKQLACVPFRSPEGRKYFSAMKCAANFAWANRQCITHYVRESFKQALGEYISLKLLYDVCHNIGKVEYHNSRKLIVHRKGATRSFPPGRKEYPEKYRSFGQPVIIPGTMGTFSYVLKGTKKAMKESLGSTCHGAGRIWSRKKARNTAEGRTVLEGLREKGIYASIKSNRTASEENPQAYKDVALVVETCRRAGLSEPVARLVPLAVVKG